MTEAIYEAGYGSNGRFYETADAVLGMTPSDFRAGGADAEIRFAVGECSLGVAAGGAERAAASARSCSATTRDRSCANCRTGSRAPRCVGGEPAFEQLVARVVGLRRGAGGRPRPAARRARHRLPAARVAGAARHSRRARRRAMPRSPQRIGAPAAVRAVARACAANTLAVAIPCHRVVRSDGGLSGYRWGVERKQRLLARERGADR